MASLQLPGHDALFLILSLATFQEAASFQHKLFKWSLKVPVVSESETKIALYLISLLIQQLLAQCLLCTPGQHCVVLY